MIRFEQVSKTYPGGFHALKQVSFAPRERDEMAFRSHRTQRCSNSDPTAAADPRSHCNGGDHHGSINESNGHGSEKCSGQQHSALSCVRGLSA